MRKRIAAVLVGASLLAPLTAVYAQDTSTDIEVDKPEIVDKLKTGETDSVVVTYPDGTQEVKLLPPEGGGYDKQLADVVETEAQKGAVSVEPNELFTLADTEVAPAGASENATTNIDDLHTLGYDGTGKAVAIIDNGVSYSISSLGVSRLMVEVCSSSTGHCGAQRDTGGGATLATGTGEGDPYASTYASYDHGTTVATAALGDTSPAIGTAPDAKIVTIRVFRPHASIPNTLVTDTSSITGAIDWVTSNWNSYGSPIVAANISISSLSSTFSAACDSTYSSTWTPSINAAKAAGVAVVIATGNNGDSNGVGLPSCISGSLAVGGHNGLNTAVYNWGSMMDTSAPAVGVGVQFPGGGFGTSSGTSLAAPQVAGLVATLAEAHGSSTGAQRQAAIESAGMLHRDLRVSILPGGAAFETRWLDGLAINTKLGELVNHTNTKFNVVSPTRIVSTWGNYGGVGVQSGTDMVVNVAAEMGVPAADIDSIVAQVTLWGDGCLSVLSPRPNGTSYTGAAGTVSPSGVVSTRQLISTNASGEVAFRLSGTCTGSATLQFAVDVSGYFGGTSDLNEINPERPVNGLVLANGTESTQTIGGTGSIPANATGIVGMLTVTQAGSGYGFHDIGPGGATLGGAAPMVSDSGGMRNNLVFTSLNGSGQVKIRNAAAPGNATYYLDVYGYTLSGSTSIVMLDPARVHDSRPSSAVSNANPRNVTLLGTGGVPSSGVKAVATNLMCIQPNATPAYFVLHKQGVSMGSNPPVDLNCVTNEFRDNTTLAYGDSTVAVHPAATVTSHFVVESMAYMPS